MSRYILNSLTLKQMGLRLLPEEKLEVAVELEGGLTDELENGHATLLLAFLSFVNVFSNDPSAVRVIIFP